MKFHSLLTARLLFASGILLTFLFPLVVSIFILTPAAEILEWLFGVPYIAQSIFLRVPYVFLCVVGLVLLFCAAYVYQKIGRKRWPVTLVIVLVLGGLFGVVALGSTNCSRCKGKDAPIKANMASLRASAEVHNESTGAYAGFCNLAATIEVANYVRSNKSVMTCFDSVATFSASAPLITDKGKYWCVDSTGSMLTTVAPVTSAESLCESLK